MLRSLLRTAGLSLLLVLAAATSAWAQTGKISGQITEAGTGEGLPGVNVVVDGTTRGAASDVDGFYTILGLPAGTVRLRVTGVGYATQIIENVVVNIDQTTTINIEMREEAIEGQEIVVTAERPVVETDVSSSRTNVTSEQIERLPVASVTAVVGLQAGVEGTSVRGSSSNELQFNLNGLTLRDERTGTAYTGIPISSVEGVQIVTGGFNAEYGNVRSGVINVTTKEGDRHRYNLDAQIRMTPPSSKNFGVPINSTDSYWIRPFVDPDVAYTGTANGAWDTYTQNSYPTFDGWLKVSERLLADADPNNDMTPEALYQAFLWQHRKTFKITQPDYNVDLGLGGPVPLLNRWGDTRFYAAMKRDQSMYFIPLSRDRYLQQTFTGKLTTDIATGVKLSLESLYGTVSGTASSRAGGVGIFGSTGMADQFTGDPKIMPGRLFGSDYWAPSRTRDFMLGARLVHALSEKSLYEVRLTRYASFYDVNPGELRDTTKIVEFGGVGFDEGPYGLFLGSSTGVEGMSMGLGFSTTRDTSRTAAYNLKADYTNQLTRAIEVKTGFEYNLTRSRMNYGQYDANLQSGNFNTRWDRSPTRASAYAQTKLEYRGLVANLGLRLDQSHAGGTWYDAGVFSPIFANATRLDTASQSPTDRLWALSPRLGVSFPITTASKLFVNYGHFRSLPTPENLYQVSYLDLTNKVTRVADPNAPLPKTVAYEVGYEQELFRDYLVRATGYYKNIFFEPLTVTYNGFGNVSYSRNEPNGYRDTRGFELTLERRRGRIVNGFVNYTYMVTQSGRFGLPTESQNPTDQKTNENSDALRRSAESRPLPSPYARAGLNFASPDDFGPSVAGIRPLGGWLASFVGSWRIGTPTCWVDGGGSCPANIIYNTRYKDFTNVDLRLARDFRIADRRVQFFADINNLFNQKRLSTNGFSDTPDRVRYFTSLHLPEAQNNEYTNIPGTDRPGDYRRAGVAYQPMFSIGERTTATSNADPNAIYYERTTGQYLTFTGGQWQAADAARVQQVLDDKAYIDMPNQGFLTFFNPRSVFFGLRLNL